jgi:hypothetical protein
MYSCVGITMNLPLNNSTVFVFLSKWILQRRLGWTEMFSLEHCFSIDRHYRTRLKFGSFSIARSDHWRIMTHDADSFTSSVVHLFIVTRDSTFRSSSMITLIVDYERINAKLDDDNRRRRKKKMSDKHQRQAAITIVWSLQPDDSFLTIDVHTHEGVNRERISTRMKLVSNVNWLNSIHVNHLVLIRIKDEIALPLLHWVWSSYIW